MLDSFKPNMALMKTPMNYAIIFLMVAIFVLAIQFIATFTGE